VLAHSLPGKSSTKSTASPPPSLRSVEGSLARSLPAVARGCCRGGHRTATAPQPRPSPADSLRSSLARSQASCSSRAKPGRSIPVGLLQHPVQTIAWWTERARRALPTAQRYEVAERCPATRSGKTGDVLPSERSERSKARRTSDSESDGASTGATERERSAQRAPRPERAEGFLPIRTVHVTPVNRPATRPRAHRELTTIVAIASLCMASPASRCLGSAAPDCPVVPSRNVQLLL
jgi:hypothetical protein